MGWRSNVVIHIHIPPASGPYHRNACHVAAIARRSIDPAFIVRMNNFAAKVLHETPKRRELTDLNDPRDPKRRSKVKPGRHSRTQIPLSLGLGSDSRCGLNATAAGAVGGQSSSLDQVQSC